MHGRSGVPGSTTPSTSTAVPDSPRTTLAPRRAGIVGGVDRTRWGRDLLANPRIEVHLPSAEQVVIVTGRFSRENDLDADSFARVQASYLARYKSYQPGDPAGLFMVKPVSALAWTVFPGNVTRFAFQPK